MKFFMYISYNLLNDSLDCDNEMFLLQGRLRLLDLQTRLIPVMAGTCDFYLTKAFVTPKFLSGNATTLFMVFSVAYTICEGPKLVA